MSLPPNTRDELANREDFVALELDLVKQRVQRADAVVAGVIMLAAAAAYVLAMVIADQLFDRGMSLATRRTLLGLAAVSGIAGLARFVVLPLSRQVSDRFAARAVERRFPELQNAVITAVELSRHDDVPRRVALGVADRAARELSARDILVAAPWRGLGRSATLFGAVFASFGLYAALAPKPVLPSFWRVLGSDRPPPTRTQIRIVSPAPDASVVVGQAVTFDVELSGRVPRDAIVEFSSNGGADWIAGEGLELRPVVQSESTAPAGARAARWSATRAGPDVQLSRDYRVVAGDAVTPVQHLEVRPVPDVLEVRFEIAPPTYTGLGTSQRVGGDIDVVAGTRVRVAARANVPIRDARLVFEGGGPAESRLLGVSGADDTELFGAWLADRDAEFYVVLSDKHDVANRDPIRYRQRVRTDAPPEVTWTSPPRIDASANGVIELTGHVRDDFGLSDVALLVESGARRQRIEWNDTNAGIDRVLRRTFRVADLGGAAGSRIECRIEATDNRHDLAGRPAYQTSVSGPILIQVGEGIANRPPRTAVADVTPRDRTGGENPTKDSGGAARDRSNGESARRADAPRAGDDSTPQKRAGPAQPDADDDSARPRKERDPATPHADKGDGTPSNGATSRPESTAASDSNESLDEFVERNAEQLQKLEDRFAPKPGAGLPDESGSAPNGERASPQAGADSPQAQRDSRGAPQRPEPPTSQPGSAEQPDSSRSPQTSQPENSNQSDSSGSSSSETEQSPAAPPSEPRSGKAGGEPRDDSRAEQPADGASESEGESRGTPTTRPRGDSKEETSPRPTSPPGDSSRPQSDGARPNPGKPPGSDDGEPSEQPARPGQSSPQGGASSSSAGGRPDARPQAGGAAGANPATGENAAPPTHGSPPSASSQPTDLAALDGEFRSEGSGEALLPGAGRTAAAVDEFERLLRLGAVDPRTLQDLGWTQAEAQRFVETFRRKQAEAQRQRQDGNPPRESRRGSMRDAHGGKVQRGGESAPGVAGVTGPAKGGLPNADPLIERGPEEVPPEYRDFVDEYYRAMSRARRDAPAKP